MSEEITAESLRYAVIYKKITKWSPRSCAICGDKLHYRFAVTGGVFWDARCQCTPEGVEPREVTYQSIANYINAHRTEVRERLWADIKGSGKPT